MSQLKEPFIDRKFELKGPKNSGKSWFRLVNCTEQCEHEVFSPLDTSALELQDLVGPKGVKLHAPYDSYYAFALDIFYFLNSDGIVTENFHFEFGGSPRGHYYLIRFLIWTNRWKSQFCDFSKVEVDTEYDNFLINHMDQFVIEAIGAWRINDNFPSLISKCSDNDCLGSKIPVMVKPTNSNFDIVIPTKNVPISGIMRCLQSIERQLTDGDQIYLVDDNEFEQVELIQIIEEYKNLHLIRGRNRGVAAARNLGLSAGNNALVSFVDSDDYLLPGYLEIQRNFHIKNPSIAATGTWLQGFGSVSTVYPQWDGINPLGLVMCLPPAGVLIWKRSILEINRFDLSFGKGFEDFDLVARVIATNYSIAVFDFPLYMYQRGHISLSQSWSPKTEQELRSKVNSNVTLLCRHKAALLFDLLSIYGKRLLVSHPDLVFRTNFGTRKPLSSLDLIVKIRKSNSIRNIWRRLPEPIRFKLFTFIVRS